MLKRIGLFVAVFFLGVCTGIVGSGDSEPKGKEEVATLHVELKRKKKELAQARRFIDATLQSRKNKKKLPVVSAPPSKTRAPANEDSLSDIRQRAFSDDATSVEEAFFHAAARAAVVMNVQPNKLRVGGSRFRVKRSPFSSGGAFVYDPRTTFHGPEILFGGFLPVRLLRKIEPIL